MDWFVRLVSTSIELKDTPRTDVMTQRGEISLPTRGLVRTAHRRPQLQLQDAAPFADPNQVSIPGVRPIGARGVGLAELHQRLGDIQRRIGMAAGASSMTGVDGVAGPLTPGIAMNSEFAMALQRAIDGRSTNGLSDGLSGLHRDESSGSSSTPWSFGSDTTAVSGLSGLSDVSGAVSGVGSMGLTDPLARIPVYATKPEGLPPVTVSQAARAAGNGRLPDHLLADISQGDHRLAKPAADAFRRLDALARQEGVTIGVRDSYRDYPGQVAVADRVGLYSQGGWAAAPGTSNHGWGLALDLELDERGQQWMTDHAWRFGFFDDVPGEPWHWTYRAG